MVTGWAQLLMSEEPLERGWARYPCTAPDEQATPCMQGERHRDERTTQLLRKGTGPTNPRLECACASRTKARIPSLHLSRLHGLVRLECACASHTMARIPRLHLSHLPGRVGQRCARKTACNQASGVVPSNTPLSSEHGTYKTVKAGFWPWLQGARP